MRIPNTFTPEQIREYAIGTKVGDRYVAARPEGFSGLCLAMRLHLAWEVFTGKADVLRWNG